MIETLSITYLKVRDLPSALRAAMASRFPSSTLVPAFVLGLPLSKSNLRGKEMFIIRGLLG